MLTDKDYSQIDVKQAYFVEYEFIGKKHAEIMDGDVLLEIENGGCDVIKYRLLTKLEKGATYLIKVPEDTDIQVTNELAEYLFEYAGIKPVIIPENYSIKKLPAKDKAELFEYIKGELGIKE